MKRLNYENMLMQMGVKNPYMFVVETEGGTIVKTNEPCSEGQVLNFYPNQVVDPGNEQPIFMSETDYYFQGFAKECQPVNYQWDPTTDVDDILIALTGEPVPPALLALLVHGFLQSQKQHV